MHPDRHKCHPDGRSHPRRTAAAIPALALLLALTAASAAGQAARAPGSGDTNARACEPAIAQVATYCGFVETSRGYRIRSILTRPESARAGRLPAVLFVQWLSCDSVLLPAEEGDGWSQMLRAFTQRSGVVVARTEKPGLGDSGGPPCEQLGYIEELDAHRHALASLRRSEHVNPDSIFIFGASMGGTMAPVLAAEGGVRGVMVWGTTAKTWAEHMVALDRRVLELRGVRADSIHGLIGDHLLMHALSLVEGRAPARLIAERPSLAAAWRRMLGTDSTGRHQYGRSFRFHQEAQQANWEGAWSTLDIPVLVVRGEYDWIMADDEHRRIADVANVRRPGLARYVVHPRMDHNFLVHASQEDAFRGRGGRFDSMVVETFLAWLSERRRPR